MAKVYMCMADGMEEVECLAVVDILKRGGVEVVMASMGEDELVTGSHGIRVKADCLWSEKECEACDAIFLPGGMGGTKRLSNHVQLGEMLKTFHKEGKLLAAICAAPTVLGKYGILEGKQAVCYPGLEDGMDYPGLEAGLTGAIKRTDGVVTDGNVVTGRGMGFAVDEGLELVRLLVSEEVSRKVKAEIQHP